MDLGDYSQFTLTKEDLKNEWPYLTEGMEGLTALMSEGRAIGIELPLQVSLRIEETRPSVKGGSVTARTKPATLSTAWWFRSPSICPPEKPFAWTPARDCSFQKPDGNKGRLKQPVQTMGGRHSGTTRWIFFFPALSTKPSGPTSLIVRSRSRLSILSSLT